MENAVVEVSERPVYPWSDATFKVCARVPKSLADDLLICQGTHGLSARAVSALAVARWSQAGPPIPIARAGIINPRLRCRCRSIELASGNPGGIYCGYCGVEFA